MFRAVPPPIIRSSKTVYTASGICRAFTASYRLREWVGTASITNKKQRYTMVFITINVLHVSGGSSAHHQELKNCIQSIGYLSNFYCFLPLAWVSWDCKYNQQEATLHNGIYYYKCSTCFRLFLCPSSGAQKLYTKHRVFVELLLLLTACVSNR